jgi:stage II sporulation protein D
MKEPLIEVGLIDRTSEIKVKFNDLFRPRHGNSRILGSYLIRAEGGGFRLDSGRNSAHIEGRSITLTPEENATFSLKGVKIGINFHWEQMEDQTFHGDLHLILRDDGAMAVINRVRLEEYLVSVISSEMGAAAPLEFLKAHAVASRSWLAAMLDRAAGKLTAEPRHEILESDSILRWYEREDHDLYDVCADDHCQRYQGITKVISAVAVRAVRETAGLFLVYGEEICDARFFKACGGLTDRYENTWEDRTVPYLTEVSDSIVPFPSIHSEEDALAWIYFRPDVFCNVDDRETLERILPAYDRETDFFRWEVAYERPELEAILKKKSGLDFGVLKSIEPLQRGPSGRISRLKISGSKKTATVGKELEIRRWLSATHLLSSAFVVETETGPDGIPQRFKLKGAGWGHGVGMCQIGAAMMALKGYKSENILKHYFPGARLEKLY